MPHTHPHTHKHSTMYACIYRYIFIPSSIRFDSCVSFVFGWLRRKVELTFYRKLELHVVCHHARSSVTSLLHTHAHTLIYVYIDIFRSYSTDSGQFMDGLFNDFPHWTLIASIALDQFFYDVGVWAPVMLTVNVYWLVACLFVSSSHKLCNCILSFGRIFHFYGSKNEIDRQPSHRDPNTHTHTHTASNQTNKIRVNCVNMIFVWFRWKRSWKFISFRF